MTNRTYNKLVDSGKLWQEIYVVFDDINDIHTYKENSIDKVYIEFDQAKDAGQWVIVDSLITAHVPVDLEDLKSIKRSLIDEKTKELIHSGYVYDNNIFSLSEHAQRNWLAVPTSFDANLNLVRRGTPSLTHAQAYDAIEAGMYPLPVSTLDDKEYIFNTHSDYMVFFNEAYDCVNGHYMSGRALKDQINNAVDESALNQIIDNR